MALETNAHARVHNTFWRKSHPYGRPVTNQQRSILKAEKPKIISQSPTLTKRPSEANDHSAGRTQHELLLEKPRRAMAIRRSAPGADLDMGRLPDILRRHPCRSRAAGFTAGRRSCPFQRIEPALSATTKSLTSRGWQILFGSSCSAGSCSAASIVEPLHHCPVAVGKSAAHLVCRPAALVACPCDPVQKIAKSQSAK
jgi:hypothetical protein